MNAMRIRLIMPTFVIKGHSKNSPTYFFLINYKLFGIFSSCFFFFIIFSQDAYIYFHPLIRTHIHASINFLFLVSNYYKRFPFDIRYRICLRLSIIEGDEIMEWLYDPPCVTKSRISLHLENALSRLCRFALIRNQSRATLINYVYLSTGTDVVLSPLA